MSESVSGQISTFEKINKRDRAWQAIQCRCQEKDKLLLSEFTLGAATLKSNSLGQTLAFLTFGYISHAYVLLLCDFGKDDENLNIGVSSRDIARFKHPIREVIVDRIKGPTFADVKRAFNQTKRQFPTYNLWSSNCKQWAAAFQKRLRSLLGPE